MQLLRWMAAALCAAAMTGTVGADTTDDCRRLLASAGSTGSAGSDADAQRRCAVAVYRGPTAGWPSPHVDAGVTWQELAPRTPLPAQPPTWVALGEQLFFDRRLSRDRDISCASCHQPHLGFADARKVALGHGGAAGTRQTPHLYGVAFVPQLMWDGRAADLETQALMPIANPIEMAMDLPALQQRLSTETDYPARFDAAFGPGGVTLRRLGEALAAFERRIEAPRTRFDEFIEGRRDALTPQELHGLHLFRTQARCMNCHSGPQLTQHEFHQIGMSFIGRRQEDRGRQAVTTRPQDLGAMRTPSLRGVRRTAPYFHQGITPNLHGVLELYNTGMPQPPKGHAKAAEIPPPSPLIRPLKLTLQDMQDLEAFLNTL
ncbi:cytochrome-c peroxidase [Roseateles sp. BYS96W]|uniref:Cytochrome-c peroxidase n=1 Tax=Pelomonas nitida TaxID=3299027 RepID=A0ABW7G9V3_9BURK